MPLLWYSGHLLAELGWQVWQVWYDYRDSTERIPQRMKSEVAEVLTKAQKGPFEQYLLVGKSLGTVAMAYAYADPALARARGIWLTPVMDVSEVRKAMLNPSAPGLAVFGTQDPAADPSLVPELKKRLEVLEIPEADHGLEVPSTLESLKIMSTYLENLETFLYKMA